MWNDYPEMAVELELVENYIRNKVKSRNKLLSTIVDDLLNSGGKRLRPALTVASANFGRYDRDKVVSVAGALEVLHMATLVHDDIIDKAKLRRGRSTVSEKYGIDLAVYTGDFLFTKAVLMLSKEVDIEKLDQVASAIKTICEGEVDQYLDKYNIDTTAFAYLKRISKKTAVLFSAAGGLGAYMADCPEDITRRLAKFGFYYGMAFQIRDDINDILSSEKVEGKPVGNDIAEGIITLPAILAAKREGKVKDALSALVKQRDNIPITDLLEILKMVKEFKGIDDSRAILKKYIERALKVIDPLPDNKYKGLLKELVLKLE